MEGGREGDFEILAIESKGSLASAPSLPPPPLPGDAIPSPALTQRMQITVSIKNDRFTEVTLVFEWRNCWDDVRTRFFFFFLFFLFSRRERGGGEKEKESTLIHWRGSLLFIYPRLSTIILVTIRYLDPCATFSQYTLGENLYTRIGFAGVPSPMLCHHLPREIEKKRGRNGI